MTCPEGFRYSIEWINPEYTHVHDKNNVLYVMRCFSQQQWRLWPLDTVYVRNKSCQTTKTAVQPIPCFFSRFLFSSFNLLFSGMRHVFVYRIYSNAEISIASIADFQTAAQSLLLGVYCICWIEWKWNGFKDHFNDCILDDLTGNIHINIHMLKKQFIWKLVKPFWTRFFLLLLFFHRERWSNRQNMFAWLKNDKKQTNKCQFNQYTKFILIWFDLT